MKNKNIEPALLTLLGMLPNRVQNEQTTMKIVVGDESITVNELLIKVIGILREGIKGKEEEELL